MLLAQKANAVDHLLGSRSRGVQPARESGVLCLKKLNALGGYDALHSG